jgi:hypothetical protein
LNASFAHKESGAAGREEENVRAALDEVVECLAVLIVGEEASMIVVV